MPFGLAGRFLIRRWSSHLSRTGGPLKGPAPYEPSALQTWCATPACSEARVRRNVENLTASLPKKLADSETGLTIMATMCAYVTGWS